MKKYKFHIKVDTAVLVGGEDRNTARALLVGFTNQYRYFDDAIISEGEEVLEEKKVKEEK